MNEISVKKEGQGVNFYLVSDFYNIEFYHKSALYVIINSYLQRDGSSEYKIRDSVSEHRISCAIYNIM